MFELLQWDYDAFHAINLGCQNAFFDALMPWLRNKYFWFPVYLFLLVFWVTNFGKKGWLLVLSLAFTIGLADVVSSHLLKKSIQRNRPCKVFVAEADINKLVPCGSGYSFPSSHAANHFAMSTFLCWVLGTVRRNPSSGTWLRRDWGGGLQTGSLLMALLLGWAALVSFAQVYVGVHFPLDVLAGAGLGVMLGRVGYISWRFWRRFVQP